MNSILKMSALALSVLGALAACGSGNDDDATPAGPAAVTPATLTGTLLDAAVSGVDYKGAASAGVTDSQGRFSCKAGETLSFSVGGIALGAATCGATVTPLDLARSTELGDDGVINRLLFLQSLDEDGTPGNGIQIDPAVKAALAGKSLDFTKNATDFGTALQSVLPTLTDKLGDKYSERPVNDTARKAALEHFESSLAEVLGRTETTSSTQPLAGTVKITKSEVFAADALNIPYEGGNAATKKDFPNGFFPAAGSGLAYKGKTADGKLEFYALTDRGPNGDGPTAPAPGNAATALTSKLFPAPSFVPALGILTVGEGGARLTSLTPLSVSAGVKASGRPFDAAAVGFSGEVPLTDALVYDAAKAGYDVNGIDPEAIVNDTVRGVVWLSDEYGPFIAKVDPATGRILKKYQPGSAPTDLPAVLAKRRPNRGMEGLSLDVASGKLHGFLQSPIDDGKATPPGATKTVNVKDNAAFIRWLEFDPATETSKLYAYPVDGSIYDKARTGSAKLGDLVSLGGGKFIVIEQGKYADGNVHNVLMLVEIPANATDIATQGSDLEKSSIAAAVVGSANYANVVTLKKTKLFDLNAAGWVAEKAEGLALVDESTLALINDNDFGLRSVLLDANGKFVEGSLEDCTVNAAGAIVSGCPAGVTSARITRGLPSERTTRLWLLKFPKKLATYSVAP